MADEYGDRMKMYERNCTDQKLMPLLPIMIRLDGRGFSRFTKGLKRPYDERLSRLMIALTEGLMKETNARIGYTQSDEISLVLYSDEHKSQVYFDGRVFKIISSLAAYVSVWFNKYLDDYLPEKADQAPTFDCRVWNVPNLAEGANTILWREMDASKNSVSMAARELYSQKQLHGKSGPEMQEMMFQKGVNWNDYPSFFKRGTFLQKRVVSRPFTAEEIEKLPPKHKAHTDPELVVERKEVARLEMPPFSKVTNRIGVVFFGEEPQYTSPST